MKDYVKLKSLNNILGGIFIGLFLSACIIQLYRIKDNKQIDISTVICIQNDVVNLVYFNEDDIITKDGFIRVFVDEKYVAGINTSKTACVISKVEMDKIEYININKFAYTPDDKSVVRYD